MAVLASLLQQLEGSATPHNLVKVASIDGYYAGQGRAYPNMPATDLNAVLDAHRANGVSALDMEAETLLIVGEALGLQAGVLLAVHANRGNDTWLEDYEPAQDRLLRIACQAMHSLVQQSHSH
jgi:uridine phosphorylase